MSNDILNREQLEAQRARREEMLRKMRAENAPEKGIAEAEKKLKLTKLRLERIGSPAD